MVSSGLSGSSWEREVPLPGFGVPDSHTPRQSGHAPTHNFALFHLDPVPFPAKERGVSITLTNPEKRALKARAQALEPVVKLGHAGLSDAFLTSLNAALALHELVKMKFTDFKDQKHDLAPQIAEKTASALVMQVGNVAVFYRSKVGAPGAKTQS